MTFLYVILAIFVFFALILSQTVRIFVLLGDSTRIVLGIGFFKFTLSPRKKKKVKISDYTYKKHQKRLARDRRLALKKREKAKKKAEKKSLKSKADSIQKKASEASKKAREPEEKLFAATDIISFALEEFPILASYIKVRIRRLHVTVGGDDAAKIAVNYGKTEALVSLLLELFENKTDFTPINEGDVIIYADFLLPKTKLEFDFSIGIRPFSIVKVGFHTLKMLIKQIIKREKRKAVGLAKG